ncbi:hypothetical protein F7725_014613 [Dissostichus mawsoni]|uniref:Uncharacterized protein n=1 Tax=Dissostichus mawsoni TaxID=36200 RepID=A0A7J5YWN0_DISMA|nr:hypothetical protein F7725_014613 [Dissostichus mawsoni]
MLNSSYTRRAYPFHRSPAGATEQRLLPSFGPRESELILGRASYTPKRWHLWIDNREREYTHLVKQSKMYLDKCILQTRDVKLEESGHLMGEEESKMEKTAHSIIGKSPFTQAFQVRRDQAQCDILSDDAVHVKNHYLCPGVIDALLKNYMGIFPLWSGLLLGDLSRHRKGTSKKDGSHKTRDTNCHVELWFGLVKHSILLKKST